MTETQIATSEDLKSLEDKINDNLANLKSEVISAIQEIKDTVVLQGPPGEKGDKGDIGNDGKNGISPDLQKIVQQVLLRIPRPKDGKDGESIQGEPGIPGKSGKDGKDITDVESELLWEAIKPFIEKRIGEIPRPLGGRIMTPARSVKPSTATITGTQNGVNQIFTLAAIPQNDAHLFLFVNGKKQKLTTDYTRSNGTITFVLAPQSTDDLEAQIFD